MRTLNDSKQYIRIDFRAIDMGLLSIISSSCRDVYLILRRFVWRGESDRVAILKSKMGEVIISCISNKRICELTGLSQRTVWSHIKKLIAIEWIKDHGVRGRISSYILGQMVKSRGVSSEIFFADKQLRDAWANLKAAAIRDRCSPYDYPIEHRRSFLISEMPTIQELKKKKSKPKSKILKKKTKGGTALKEQEPAAPGSGQVEIKRENKTSEPESAEPTLFDADSVPVTADNENENEKKKALFELWRQLLNKEYPDAVIPSGWMGTSAEQIDNLLDSYNIEDIEQGLRYIVECSNALSLRFFKKEAISPTIAILARNHEELMSEARLYEKCRPFRQNLNTWHCENPQSPMMPGWYYDEENQQDIQTLQQLRLLPE